MLACVGKVHIQRMCWPGRTEGVHAEETFVRFLVIAAFCRNKWTPMAFVGGHFSEKSSSAHIAFTLYLPKYQITRNSRIVSEQPEIQHEMVIYTHYSLETDANNIKIAKILVYSIF